MWRLLFLMLVLGWAAAFPQAAQASQPATPSFWGSHEKNLGTIRYFKMWTKVLRRFADRQAQLKEPCDPDPYVSCGIFYWAKFIDEIKGKSRSKQIEAVNTYMNRVRYVRDPINWGLRDYWETPWEFFDKQGDCEDYAITKYMTFRRLGYPPADMRIVVVNDLNTKIVHAVLLVRQGKSYMVLDNLLKVVVDANRIKHYRVI